MQRQRRQTRSSRAALAATAVLALATSAAATPAPYHEYSIARRSRTFADEHGVFDPKLFKEDYDHVAAKYRHANERYKRNLAEGKVQHRKRDTVVHPVHDLAALDKRQSSGGSSGSVELIDCELGPPPPACLP